MHIVYCITKEKEGSKMLQFRVQLAQELLLESGMQFTTQASCQEPVINRLERHFITSNFAKTTGLWLCSKRKACVCKQCTLLMDAVPCFELHHTKVDLQR